MNHEPESPQTRSEARFERERLAITYFRLHEYPEGQAEAIARHYLSVFTAARTLQMLVGLREGGPRPGLEEAIRLFTNTIRRAHAGDLGIALDWCAPVIDFVATSAKKDIPE